MAFGKVDKYGVPISNEIDERAPLAQPKFVNRFRVFLVDFGNTRQDENGNALDKNSQISNNIVTSMVESFNRPTLNFGTQEATSFIGRAKYSGRMKHENFSFVLRDDISNSVISKVYAQAKKQTYKFHPVTAMLQKSPYLGIDTKFVCIFQLMDGRTNHKALETWTFFGCTIDSIEPTSSSYDDGSNIVKLTVNCAFDDFDITQEERLILPQSFSYDDGLQSNGSSQDDNEELGFFDQLRDTGSDLVDSGTSLYNKAKDSVSGFFSDNDSEQNNNTNSSWWDF